MTGESNDITNGESAAEKPLTASERARAFLSAQKGSDSEKEAGASDGISNGGAAEGLNAGAISALVQAGGDNRRGEVSAATIGRMLGLVTTSDLQIIENKIDLVSAKLGTFVSKVDKVASTLAELPSGADLERIEVQLGTLRSLIKEGLLKTSQGDAEGGDRELSKTKIQSNHPQTFGGKVITRIQPKEES